MTQFSFENYVRKQNEFGLEIKMNTKMEIIK